MKSRHTTWFLVAIFAAFTYLGFKGLDNAWFWDDESFASIMAGNWNRTGKLTAWDGRNLAAYSNGKFLAEDMVNQITPVHFFMVAQSQKLFGATTFAGRFPSVVFGLIALALIHKILCRQFGRGSLTHLYMTGIWALAASPMLFTRNGRYYSLALALLLGSYLLYIIYVEKRNPLTLLGLAVLAIISYFTHPLIWISSFAALGLHFILFHLRSLTRKDILWIGTAGALVAAVCLPVLLKHRTWDLAYETPTAWYLRRPLLLWFYLRDLNLLGIFAWPVALAASAFAIIKVSRTKNHSSESIRPWLDWAVIGLGFLVALCCLSKQSTGATSFSDMRYLFPALPFFTIFLVTGCVLLHRVHPALGLSLAFVCTLTNVMGYIPGERWNAKWLLPAYLREIHNPYPTAVEGVTTYLKDKVTQDDVVYVVPEFESFPLMFYLGDQVKLGGLLSETIPIKAKVPGDPGYLYRERVAPDWIVLYGLHVDPATLVDYFGREQPGVPPSSYKLETILNVFWRNTQKPEPAAHRFSPITDFDPKREGVIILKRTPAPTPPEKGEP